GTKNIDHRLFQFVLLALYLLQSTRLLLGGGPGLWRAIDLCYSNITGFEDNVERSSESRLHCVAEHTEIFWIPEILQRKFVVKANDKFMLIKAQGTTMLHVTFKRGTPLCDTLLQGLPQTFCSTEHCALRHLRQRPVSDRHRGSLFSRPCAPRRRLRILH